MKKNYLRLERRNTRFKLETINQSEFTESANGAKPINEQRAAVKNEADNIEQSEGYIDDLLSNNKTDPFYKSKKKSLYRSRSLEGKEIENV